MLKTILLDSLAESKTNPRRHFDSDKILELSASIREVGLLQPLVVRQHPQDETAYEVIAGARRLRACKLADLEEVPCLIITADDRQVLELQLVENSQRADVSPLEEAEGYQRLVEDHGYTPAAIARKVGHTVAHIQRRLRLLDLCEAAKSELANGRMLLGHALMLAALDVDDQIEVMSKVDEWYGTDSLLSIPLEDFRRDIEVRWENLNKAPFSLQATDLGVGKPACTQCPYNTAAQSGLFDHEGAWCTKPACYEGKLDTFVQLQLAKAKDEARPLVVVSTSWMGKDKAVPAKDWYELTEDSDLAKPGEVLVDAIITQGPRRGETFKAFVKEEALQPQEEASAPAEPQESHADRARREQAERGRKAQLNTRIRIKLMESLKEVFHVLCTAETLNKLFYAKPFLSDARCRRIFAHMMNVREEDFAKGVPDSFWESLATADEWLTAFTAAKLCSDAVCSEFQWDKELTADQKEAAEEYGIDLKAIRKAAKAELKAEEEAAAAPKPEKKKGRKAKPAKPKPASEETWQQSAIAALRQHQPCTKSELLDHCLMRRLGHTAKQDKAVRTAAYQALWSALASLGKHKQVVKIEENGLDKLRLAREVQG